MLKGLRLKYCIQACYASASRVTGGGVWIYFFCFYFSGLEGVGRTRGLPCLARGFAVLGLDSIKRRAGGDLFLGAFGGSLLVVLGFGVTDEACGFFVDRLWCFRGEFWSRRAGRGSADDDA